MLVVRAGFFDDHWLPSDMLLRLWAGAAVLASAGGARHKHASSTKVNIAVVRQSGQANAPDVWMCRLRMEDP